MKNRKFIVVFGVILSYILFIICNLYIKDNYEGAFDTSSYEFIIYIPIIFGISYFKSNKRMEKRKNNANITSIIFIILVAVMLIFMLYEPITYIYLTICIIYVLGFIFKTKWFKYLENEKNGSLVMFIFVYIFTSVVYMAFPHICGLKTIEESKSIIEQKGYENVEYINISRRGDGKFGNYNFFVDSDSGERVILSINSKTLEIE